MNFLAHLYLGPQAPEPMLGSLLGDFVKGRVPDLALPDGIREGIWLHRQIDVFTDTHPLFLRSRQRVSAPRRRFAGIMVDMFYDHLLARHWADYHPEPLNRFTAHCYRQLLAQREHIPDNARPVVERMARYDWLGSYAEVGSLHRALDNMASRLKRENALAGGVAELEADYAGFEADFRAFLPEVLEFAQTQATLASAAAGSGRS